MPGASRRRLMRIAGFEWDDSDRDKNLKHGITDDEAEEPFYR